MLDLSITLKLYLPDISPQEIPHPASQSGATPHQPTYNHPTHYTHKQYTIYSLRVLLHSLDKLKKKLFLHSSAFFIHHRRFAQPC